MKRADLQKVLKAQKLMRQARELLDSVGNFPSGRAQAKLAFIADRLQNYDHHVTEAIRLDANHQPEPA